jgi:arabinogalactan oligomer/maltooligosaccharide transport system substrate-binding protein
VWAYPQGIDCLVLYYDRASFQKISEAPPRDTEALIRVAKRLTVDDQGRDAFHPQHDPARAARHGLFLKSDGYYFLPFLWAWGGEAVDPDTRAVRIADPASVEAAGRFQDMALRQNIIPEKLDVATEYQEELARFGDGRVAMIVNGPWAAREILASPRFSDPTKLGVAPVPRGLDDQGGSPVGGHGYVISARSSHPTEARLLASFLAGPRAQALLARRNHIPPTLTKLYDEPELANDPLLAAFRQALDESRPRASFPGMARLFDALTPAVQRLLRGEGDPATLMGGVAREWSTIVPPP